MKRIKSNLKSLLLMLLACAMLSMPADVSAESAIRSDAFVGTWYAMLEAEESVIDLKSNGFLTMDTGSLHERGFWRLEDNVLRIQLEEKDEMAFTYSGNDGYLMDMESGVILSRNPQSSMAVPEYVDVTDIRDFNGEWIMSGIFFLDSVMTAEGYISILNMVGDRTYTTPADLRLSIENGTVTLFTSGKPLECSLLSGYIAYMNEPGDEYEIDGEMDTDEAYFDKIHMTKDHTLVYEGDGILMSFVPYAE